MNAPRSDHNTQGVPPGAKAGRFLWDEFDALPPILRDLINYTPHTVATSRVFAEIQGGRAPQAVARDAYRRWSRYAREETLALYGPTHPQVQSHDA